MYVTVSHDSNPDINDGYWQIPLDDGHKIKVQVKDLTDASDVCRKYIERNGLGGGNWTGGDVFKDGKRIAKVCYNGKIEVLDKEGYGIFFPAFLYDKNAYYP